MRVLIHDRDTGKTESGGLELLDRWQPGSGRLAWLDFQTIDPTIREAVLEDRLGLHPLALQDALRQRHPPKVERFGSILFLMLRELDAVSDDLDFGYVGVSLFVGPDLLVTRSTGVSATIEKIWDRLAAGTQPLESTDALALEVADGIVRRYLPVLLGLEPRLDALEDEIFESPSDALLAELTRMKSRLKLLRRIFAYHGQVLSQLGRIPGLELTVRYEHELVDVTDQVMRSASLADLYYELASDLADGYLGLSSHRLNQVMKVLTIITVIFVPLSFLAGVYGMNFENMPELHTRSGYFVLLSLMGCVVGIQVYLFRRKKWL